MTTPQTGNAVSRRTALAGLGAGGLGLALAATARPAAAQDATAEAMANHPIVGAWMVAAPTGPALAVFLADGTNIQGVPTAQAGPQGVTFTGAQVGTWEPVSERGIHFTGVQLLTDATGAFVGTVTIDGHPVVSEDGQTARRRRAGDDDHDPRRGAHRRRGRHPVPRRRARDRGPDGGGGARVPGGHARGRHPDGVTSDTARARRRAGDDLPGPSRWADLRHPR